MALASAVEGARYIAQSITWTDEDGTAVNLTGATLTGKKRDLYSGTVSALDGTLSITTAASGIFSWAYGETDVGTPGDYEVQFTATYPGGLKELTLRTVWKVYAAIGA